MNKQFKVVFVICDCHLEDRSLSCEMSLRKLGVATISLAAVLAGCYYLFNTRKVEIISKVFLVMI